MPKVNPIRAIILTIIVSIFTFGVTKLFLLRFEAGDVYPAYSTLRSDPLGNRAFYRSLSYLNATLVSRNYRPLRNLEFKQGTALFYIGTPVFDSGSVSNEWLKVFERLTSDGGRLVLSFLPVEKKPANWRMETCAKPTANIKDSEESRQQNEQKDSRPRTDNGENEPVTAPKTDIADENLDCASLKERWGLTFGFADQPSDKAVRYGKGISAGDFKELPQEISWHTALFFDDLDDIWRVIYAADGRPVIIERAYGNGSLVLSADSFFMSNEAMRSERYPRLLAWIIGESSKIVFDETHFGIFKHPGVLTLIKKYRFQWFIFTVAILALLFIWKNSVYFVPPPRTIRSGADQDVISDRDFSQGLISLLRRNIPRRKILQTCGREWERSFQPEKRFQNEKLKKIKAVIQKLKSQSSKSIDPVSGYRRISKIISKGRHYE